MSESDARLVSRIGGASARVAGLARLNEHLPQLTPTERDTIRHALVNGDATVADNTDATSAAVGRISVSVRANDLLSPSWMGEATSLVALFAIETRGASAAYRLLSQTEVVSDSNAPVFQTPFVLDASLPAESQQYMLRVYEAGSDVVDEAAYIGLAAFNLAEVTHNCRVSLGANAAAGGFVSIVLPLLNPANATANDELVASHATITLSFQLPPTTTTGAADAQASVAPAAVQCQYTRLLNYLAPDINAINMDLAIGVESASAEAVSAAATAADLVSVWYRPRSTALFQLLATVPVGAASTASSPVLVVSDELLLVAENDEEDLDTADAGFELRLRAHNTARLPTRHALTTARNTERSLGVTVNQALSSAEKDAASTPATSSVEDPALLGSATLAFKTLLAARDDPNGIVVPLEASEGGAAIRLKLRTRPGIEETSTETPAAVLATPSTTLLPPTLLAKARDLLRNGIYLTQYESATAAASSEVFVKVVDGATPVLQVRAADAPNAEPRTIDLGSVSQIYGGRATVGAFASLDAELLPAEDTLLTLATRDASVTLSLSAPATTERDFFAFAVRAEQTRASLPVAQWTPATVSGASATRIIAPAKQPEVPLFRPPSGSLARTPRKPAASVASPTSAGGAPSDGDLGEVLAKLEKLFEQGRNFMRFTSGGHKPHYISLFLRKEEPNAAATAAGAGAAAGTTDAATATPASVKPKFTLYWCRADQRVVSSSRSIRCDEVLGVALGKQSGVFRKAEASLAPASHCFSIICAERSLHLQTWSERDADTYAFGLASLVKQCGVTKPRLWQSGQYTEELGRLEVENASEMREESDGTLQVDPKDVPALANAQGYKCTVELTIKCKNLPSKNGNHIVCMFDRDDATEKLTYIAQTERQARTVNVDFRKTFKLTYDSLVTRKLRFNVYDLPTGSKQMDDEDRMGAAVVSLKEVVDAAGIEFVFKLTHETASKQQALAKVGATIVVQCAIKSEMAIEAGATGASEKAPSAQAIAASLATAAVSDANREAVRRLQTSLVTGDVVTVHEAGHAPAKQFLFYAAPDASVATSSTLGSLHWCEVGARVASAASSFQVGSLSEVVIGRASGGDGAAFNAEVSSHLCFSLRGDADARVDLEARNARHRDELAFAIVAVARAAGRTVRVQQV